MLLKLIFLFCIALVLNLKTPEGQALCHALVEKADVLVESFRPGVMSRLGLDPEALLATHPRLILCSLSGYGQRTALRNRAGHDLNYMARSGLLGIQGPAGGPPQVPGANISDVAGGSYPAAMGVLAALLERNQTGVGRWLDVSLTRSVIGFNPVLWSSALQGTPRGRDMLTGAAPCYRCYETADGRYMAVGALEPNFWSNLCELAQSPHLVALQYDTRPEAHAQVAELMENGEYSPFRASDAVTGQDGVEGFGQRLVGLSTLESRGIVSTWRASIWNDADSGALTRHLDNLRGKKPCRCPQICKLLVAKVFPANLFHHCTGRF